MRYGEIVRLGRHTLMCGDATRGEDIKALITSGAPDTDTDTGEKRVDLFFTDPPYGMKIQRDDGAIGSGSRAGSLKNLRPECFYDAKKYPLILGDDSQSTARKHYELVKDIAEHKIIWGGQYFANFLPVSGGWIFWDKRNGNTDFSDGELAWRSWGQRVKKYEHLWNGLCREGNYVLNPKPRVHPTQKPVELHMKILEDFSEPGDVVLDCFGGSGTTLIACEMTGRTCLMMELSPEYCDVIINRYEDITRQKNLF